MNRSTECSPLRAGKLASPTCGACGALAERVFERHLVWNTVDVRPDGVWGGLGDTVTESTQLVRDVGGFIRVRCHYDHEWMTRVLFEEGESNLEGEGPRFKVRCLKCNEQNLFVESVTLQAQIPLEPGGFQLTGYESSCEEIVRCRSCGHREELAEYAIDE